MHFPRFWAKGSADGFECWRWSNNSFTEAQSLAREAASRVAHLIKSGGRFAELRYAYGDRPLREQVLRALKSNSGDTIAAVTRNSYGCLILNTAHALFVDADLPRTKARGILGRLLGRSSEPDPREAAIAKARQWVEQHHGFGMRIYRTCAGLRFLAVHDRFEPDTPVVNALFEQLGADPLYRQLCKSQKCFRARLTPKPWRCSTSAPPVTWPFPDGKAESRFREWEARYQSKSAGFRTCELVAAIGNTSPHPDLQPIIQLHDEHTKISTTLPLA